MTEMNYNIFNEEAGAKEDISARASFGKVTIENGRFIHWVDNQPNEVTQEVFVTLPQNSRSMELIFTVDIQEFRPDLDFEYKRTVRVGDADWWKTVRPSIESTMGKNSMSKGQYGKTLEKLNGSYVEVHDVPKQKEADYNTIKFVKVFDSRDACFNVWQERYGGNAETATTGGSSVPDGWDKALWEQYIPEIKEKLAAGTPASELAASYGVSVPDILALQK